MDPLFRVIKVGHVVGPGEKFDFLSVFALIFLDFRLISSFINSSFDFFYLSLFFFFFFCCHRYDFGNFDISILFTSVVLI